MRLAIKILTPFSKLLMRLLSPDGSIRQPRIAAKCPKFYGKPAVAKDLGNLNRDFQNPFFAPEGRNGMHGDSYNTEAYPFMGTLGHNPVVKSKSLNVFGGMLATLMFDSKGRIMAISGNVVGFRLLLIDADTLEVLAETRLPQRASTKQFFKTLDFSYISNDTSGGAYCHLLKGDRPIIGNSHNVIQIYRLNESGAKPKWEIEKEWDIAPYLPKGSYIQDALPDYDGNIWFVTRFGQIGFVDTQDKIHITTIKGEEIHNTFAIGSDGVFLNSNFAQYKFSINEAGNPYVVWRTVYDRGTSQKPGSIMQGSGTTPTLLDVPRTDGSTARLVAISDHADDRIHVVIYNRDTGEVISETPLFDHGRSVTENSLIAYDRSFIIENNYTETGSAFLSKNPTGYPGVARVEVNADATGAKQVWESREASPTTVPKLSIKNGLVYLYTREIHDDIPKKAVAWYLTAIDYETGETVFKIFTGVGRRWNNSYAPITIGPNGTVYVGVFNGVVAIQDTTPSKSEE